jgi:hypothetical protein
MEELMLTNPENAYFTMEDLVVWLKTEIALTKRREVFNANQLHRKNGEIDALTSVLSFVQQEANLPPHENS